MSQKLSSSLLQCTMMNISISKCIALILFSFLFHPALNAVNKDEEIPGPICPNRCHGFENNTIPKFPDWSSCFCDRTCHTFGDCCIDAKKDDLVRDSKPRGMNCLNYNENFNEGVYMISKCRRNWNGPKQVKEKCESSSTDLRDPISAAPATSMSQKVTYRNMYCAKCNNAPMGSLKLFSFKIGCKGVDDVPKSQIVRNLMFNRKTKSWGINRRDDQGEVEFVACDMYFDIPSYLNNSVRFCWADIASECALDWTGNQVEQKCKAYTSVVCDKKRAYRNPHCAICNHVDVDDLKCFFDKGWRRPFSLSTLIDFNRKVRNTCPSSHIYDPFTNSCRKLSCALPGYVIRNGQCSPGT